MLDPETCRRLSSAFYARVGRDPVLRPLFPGKTLTCAIEEFSAWLIQFLEGPAELTQRRWWLSLRESHNRFRITPEHREVWLRNMRLAFSDARIDAPALLDFFEHASGYIVNQNDPTALDPDLDRRWNTQLAIDETVAAIRGGNTDVPFPPAASRQQIVGLIALLIAARSHRVAFELAKDPSLAHSRCAARTLLHEAAAHGNLPVAKLLLDLGADPDVLTGGSHTPLYCVANECTASEGSAIVRLLGDRGANVNAADGVKRCTALHMAARRGHIETAGALLGCGANLEARDSLGETPLRRAVNCNKVEMAAFLLSRGADRNSVGSERLTPTAAARTPAMKAALASTRSKP